MAVNEQHNVLLEILGVRLRYLYDEKGGNILLYLKQFIIYFNHSLASIGIIVLKLLYFIDSFWLWIPYHTLTLQMSKISNLANKSKSMKE